MEFPYRIRYFSENGREATNGVQGEGRYYNEGLYLHESRYVNIKKPLRGPKPWGCQLWSDPSEGYRPNGLDCSGYISWVMLNGGFDVGDIGAGESAYPHQLTDTGKFTSVTNSLIKSGQIKVGDLFNLPGHISIIIGIDDENFYVAESLNTYKGLVVKTYSKKKVMRTFKYVVLMDDVYKNDGKLTNMWY